MLFGVYTPLCTLINSLKSTEMSIFPQVHKWSSLSPYSTLLTPIILYIYTKCLQCAPCVLSLMQPTSSSDLYVHPNVHLVLPFFNFYVPFALYCFFLNIGKFPEFYPKLTRREGMSPIFFTPY